MAKAKSIEVEDVRAVAEAYTEATVASAEIITMSEILNRYSLLMYTTKLHPLQPHQTQKCLLRNVYEKLQRERRRQISIIL